MRKFSMTEIDLIILALVTKRVCSLFSQSSIYAFNTSNTLSGASVDKFRLEDFHLKDILYSFALYIFFIFSALYSSSNIYLIMSSKLRCLLMFSYVFCWNGGSLGWETENYEVASSYKILLVIIALVVGLVLPKDTFFDIY